MTSKAMTEDWGATREKARVRRRQRRSSWVMAAALLFGLGVPRLIAGTGLTGSAAQAVTLIGAGLFAVAIAVTAWIAWRDCDEVQKTLALRGYAGIGFATVALYPMLKIAQPVLHIADIGWAAWIAALVAGAVTFTYWRLRS